jgi:hypothetical protein
VDRAGLGPANARSPCQLAGALQGSSDRVGRVVDGHARGLEQDLGIEASIEQELRGVVPPAGERGQEVRRGRLLASLLREIFGGSPERDELRLPGRLSPLHLPVASHGLARRGKKQPHADAPPRRRATRGACRCGTDLYS